MNCRSWHRRAWVAGTLLTLAGTIQACSSKPIILPARDFDRPADLAFGCLGIFKDQATGAVSLSGQPMDQCHPPHAADPKPALTDAVQYRTYGYMTNAGRGDVSIIDFSYCRPDDSRCFPAGADIVDLDSEATGFTAAPVGVLPEVVAASQDGCRVVTANRGSCDLTLIDPSLLLAKKWGASPASSDAGIRVVTPHKAGQNLDLAPAEIAFLPQDLQATTLRGPEATGDLALCSVDGTLAPPVGETSTGRVPWRAVVTFPSCDLVALLDLPSGAIVDSYQLTPSDSGMVYHHTGADPVCPIKDCGSARTVTTCSDPAGTGGVGGTSPGTGGAATGGALGTAGAGGSAGGNDGADASVDASSSDDAVSMFGAAAGNAGSGSTALALATASGSCPGLRVGPLAIRPEGTRVYFGALNSSFVGALDVVAGSSLAEPAVGKNTVLHEGAGGVTRLRLSVDPFEYVTRAPVAKDQPFPALGGFVKGARPDRLEFLYALARDATLRVMDVSGLAPTECDLAIDPTDPLAKPPEGTAFAQACFPVDAVKGPRRLPYWAGVEPHVAGGPGLHFPSPPVDITFANYTTPESAVNISTKQAVTNVAAESVLNGAYAFVMTAAGPIYVLNLDPVLRKSGQVRVDATAMDPPRYPEPPPLVNSLRDTSVVTYSSSLGSFAGPPRLDSVPSQPTSGPRLLEFETKETRINARSVPIFSGGVQETWTYPTTAIPTYVYFPNRYLARPQTWTIAWEGLLSGSRYSGVLGATPDGSSLTLRDDGAPFCSIGALPGDTVTLVGCQQDSDCPTRVCVKSDRVASSVDGKLITGLCLKPGVANALRDGECRGLLESFRRYEIVTSTSSLVTLRPKFVERPRPVLANGAACNVDADCNLENDGTTRFKCTAAGKGAGQPSLRCLRACSDTSACTAGTTCVPQGDSNASYCVEGAPINGSMLSACLDQLAVYRVNAGNAFIVAGSSAGRPDIVTERQGSHECSVDEKAAASLRISRISMNTPACTGSASFVKLGAGEKTPQGNVLGSETLTLSPNPCVVSENADSMGATGTGGAGTTSGSGGAGGDVGGVGGGAGSGGMSGTGGASSVASVQVKKQVWFQNQELRFVLENFEKPFGNTVQITFDVHGGLSPLQVSTLIDGTPSLPARILVGPVSAVEQTEENLSQLRGADANAILPELPYLYVIDQRQYSSGRLVGRGQLLRIQPRVSGVSAGFEGVSTSNHYFPIQ